MVLRVGYIKDGTMALGPGRRFSIWTQGCFRRCECCVSPEYQILDGGYLVDTRDLAGRICSCLSIDGITISGGEPFLQAKALYDLLNLVKEGRPELTVLVFTGNKLEELNDIYSKLLLSRIDLLIDGEYISELNDGIGLRGSRNQRFHFLTDRLSVFRNEIEKGVRKEEVHWDDEDRKEMRIIGIPNPFRRLTSSSDSYNILD